MILHGQMTRVSQRRMACGHLLSHLLYIRMTEALDHPGLSAHTVISKGNFDQMPGLQVHQAVGVIHVGLGIRHSEVRMVLVDVLARTHCAKVAEHLLGAHGHLKGGGNVALANTILQKQVN